MRFFPFQISMICFLAYLCKECCCISVTEVVAPPVIKVGGTADLECRWQLQNEEQLESVKWYHGPQEIYRYTPSKPNKVKVFADRYLVVDQGNSWKGRVRVSNLSLDAEGLFRCEVSAEAPSFFTDYGTINITVVALPSGGPHIVGIRPQYQVKDWVDLTCLSQESKPATNIDFSINGKPPSESWLEPRRVRPGSRGKQVASRRMQFTIKSELLGPGGKITIQCEAGISGLHRGTSQVHLNVVGPFLASVRGEPLDSGSMTSGEDRLLFFLLWTCCFYGFFIFKL